MSLFENSEDVESGLFCSELVAALYKELKLLGEVPPSNAYIPSDFADSRKQRRGMFRYLNT